MTGDIYFLRGSITCNSSTSKRFFPRTPSPRVIRPLTAGHSIRTSTEANCAAQMRSKFTLSPTRMAKGRKRCQMGRSGSGDSRTASMRVKELSHRLLEQTYRVNGETANRTERAEPWYLSMAQRKLGLGTMTGPEAAEPLRGKMAGNMKETGRFMGRPACLTAVGLIVK